MGADQIQVFQLRTSSPLYKQYTDTVDIARKNFEKPGYTRQIKRESNF
jgi:hypothetical protein